MSTTIHAAHREEGFISTWACHSVNLTAPRQESITAVDISRGLAYQFRFGGHTNRPYTVAQHCIFVSHLVPPEHALQALLHDATEAYIGDMPSPAKELCPDYRELEARLHATIMKRFKLPTELAEEVRLADRIALATERRDLMPWAVDQHWGVLDGIEPAADRIDLVLSPGDAFWHFHQRLNDLTAKHEGRAES